MSAGITVQASDVVVRLTPEPGANFVTAEELLKFARIAVANAGPTALVLVGVGGLNAHRSVRLEESS